MIKCDPEETWGSGFSESDSLSWEFCKPQVLGALTSLSLGNAQPLALALRVLVSASFS